jgi:hypothetical protein
MYCCVLGCRTGYKPTKKYPNPLKHCVFTFPKDVELRAKWIATNKLNKQMSDDLCEAVHTKKNMLIQNFQNCRPSITLFITSLPPEKINF